MVTMLREDEDIESAYGVLEAFDELTAILDIETTKKYQKVSREIKEEY